MDVSECFFAKYSPSSFIAFEVCRRSFSLQVGEVRIQLVRYVIDQSKVINLHNVALLRYAAVASYESMH